LFDVQDVLVLSCEKVFNSLISCILSNMKYYICDLLIFSSIKASWYKCKVQCKLHFHPNISIHTPSNGVIANLQYLTIFFLAINCPYLLNIYYWKFIIPNKNLLFAHDQFPLPPKLLFASIQSQITSLFVIDNQEIYLFIIGSKIMKVKDEIWFSCIEPFCLYQSIFWKDLFPNCPLWYDLFNIATSWGHLWELDCNWKIIGAFLVEDFKVKHNV